MSSTEQPPVNLDQKEIDLIKRTFQGNESLLKSIRALFFGLSLSEAEKALIKSTFASAELRAIMWRRFHPSLDRESPIGQVQDVWLGVEQMVFGQSKDAIYQAVNYKAQALEMVRTSLARLENPSLPAVALEYVPQSFPIDDLQVFLLARNQYIRHVEQQLVFLKIIAEQQALTPAQKSKQGRMDSVE